MASETATALAVREEEAVEIVDAKPCPDMLALMADAKAAEELVPWTDEEIGKATLAELGERVRLVCSHFKLAIISEHDFVMRCSGVSGVCPDVFRAWCPLFRRGL